MAPVEQPAIESTICLPLGLYIQIWYSHAHDDYKNQQQLLERIAWRFQDFGFSFRVLESDEVTEWKIADLNVHKMDCKRKSIYIQIFTAPDQRLWRINGQFCVCFCVTGNRVRGGRLHH